MQDPREEVQRGIERLQKRREKLLVDIASVDADLRDFQATLRVLDRLSGQAKSDRGAERPTAVKDVCFDILEEAFPAGLQAAEIKERGLARYGMDINSNTLTVSLGRLKDAGQVRIEGRTWFYVPPESEAAGSNRDAGPAASSIFDQDGGAEHEILS